MASRPLLVIAAAGLLLAGCRKQPRARGADPEPTAADPPSVAPEVTAGEIVTSQPDAAGHLVEMRAAVSTLAPGDPLWLALHVRGAGGPLQPSSTPGRPFSRLDWLRSLEFTITAPGGAAQTVTIADVDLHGVALVQDPSQIDRTPTLVLEIEARGAIERVTGTRGEFRTPIADPSRTGVWTIAVRGSLRDQPFTLPALTFQRSHDAVPLAALRRRGDDAIAATLGKPVSPAATMEAGFVVGMIVERPDGTRVYRVAEAPAVWVVQLWTVRFGRDGQTTAQVRTVQTCVAAGTRVTTPDGERAIETLTPGDHVIAIDPATGRETRSQIRVVRVGHATRTLAFAGGLRVTGNHPVFANGEFVAAASVTPDARIITRNGAVRAGPATTIDEPTRVYDLTTDPPHTFIAGGVLVHNKQRIYSHDLDDPWHFMWAE